MAFRVKPLDAGPIPKAPTKRPRDRRIRNKEYLGFLHQLPCCVSGVSRVVAHHIRVGRGRMGAKEDDSLALPLAYSLHDQHPGALHVIGERNFWNRYGINPLHLTDDLWALYEKHGPAVAAAHQVISAHRQIGQLRVQLGIDVFDRKVGQ